MIRLYDIHGVKLDGEEVRELGEEFAPIKDDYDGLTLIDVENLKEELEEDPDREDLKDIIMMMEHGRQAIYDGSGIIHGEYDDIMERIADNIERATSYHELVQMMRKIGIKQRVSARPEMGIGSHVYDDDQLKKIMEESDGYREDAFTVVRTSPEGELEEEFEVVETFKTFDEALQCVGHEQIDDTNRDCVEEGMNIFYIISRLEVMNVTVY